MNMRKIKIIVKDRQAPEVNIFLLIIKLTTADNFIIKRDIFTSGACV